MPESGTAHPLRLQPPYGGVSPHSRGASDGMQGRSSSCSGESRCGLWSEAWSRPGDSKSIEHGVACGRVRT